MAISFSLAPIPKWLFNDNQGRPLAAGYMETFSNLNKTVPKAVYSDPSGSFAYTPPVRFDENGQAGPFYWRVNSTQLEDTYYLVVYSESSWPNTPIFTIENYGPPSASGGGGAPIVTVNNVINYITNNTFQRNIGTKNTSTTLSLTVAPSNHSGLTTHGDSGLGASDIVFLKSSAQDTDSISFGSFLSGANDLNPDMTQNYYMNYTCSVSAGVGTTKRIQFPICADVQNFSGQPVSISIWARGNSGTKTITAQWVQFFGDGTGASSPVILPISTFNLTTSFVKNYVLGTVIPSVSTKNIGTCGNSALYLQFVYPTNAICNIDITKPCVFIGNNIPTIEAQTLSQIDPIICSPRTGDLRWSVNTFAPFGWVPMNDGSIGSATSSATTRAHIDTFPLYNLIWNNTPNNLAPVVGSKGATAILDFEANKPIYLTKALGRVLAGAPALNEPAWTNQQSSNVFTAETFTNIITITLGNGINPYNVGDPVMVSSSGLPAPLQSNTVYYMGLLGFGNVCKLFYTPEDAIANTNEIDITTAGTGTHFLLYPAYPIGSYRGANTHVQTLAELAQHDHTAETGFSEFIGSPGGTKDDTGAGGAWGFMDRVASSGSSAPFNIMQPTAFYNVFIKL